MRRSGFTILELLIAIAILGILVGLVAEAAGGAYWTARKRRMGAIEQSLQTAIETYNLRNGKWPGALEKYATTATEKPYILLSDDEADSIFNELLRKSCQKGTNPYLDPQSMFVARKTIAGDSWKRKGGMDFNVAMRQKIPVSQLTVGYPTFNKSHFHRFTIIYKPSTDAVVVMHCCQKCGVTSATEAGMCTEEKGQGINAKCPNSCHDY